MRRVLDRPWLAVVLAVAWLAMFAAVLWALSPAAGSTSVVPRATSTGDDPAVFFVAHQDDETITMGASIARHVAAGRRVVVVLLTDGSSSGGCPPLSRAECTSVRDALFRAATSDLGAEPVIPEGRAVDGMLTVADAVRLESPWVAAFPSGSFKAQYPFEMAYPGGHPDHAAAGQALLDLAPADMRFYVKPYQFDAVSGGWFTPTVDVDRSLRDYRMWWWTFSSEFHRQLGGARSRILAGRRRALGTLPF